MLPRINQMLFLSVPSGDSRKEYKTRVCDEDADTLAVEVPIEVGTGRWHFFQPGEEVNAAFFHEGTRFVFQTVVVGRRDETVKQILLRKPDPREVVKEQRRSFLRVPASVDIAVRWDRRWRAVALTRDISGGGVSFYYEGVYPLEPGMSIDGWLLVPFRNGRIDHAKFAGEVVRVESSGDEGGSRRLVMVRFDEISEAERQKIVRFCFERELEMRRK
ncbi:MAG: hypothetical protein BLM47_08420 [Candidatus Reconcilbacillus cellulovorans]|uniref:Glycosyl transferase n=1 Tax=Candidatus Reconcilbacillus cellulovorans TaxID=1906605 RepID=A0A2A6DZN1_9BACL|nr:MAG: hypothetical protein BLM47_08420 [Candidatus Reconcilbacillus cellulovorans]